MELRHLRYFMAVSRSSSFTHASDELCVSQPTISHQIKQLEDEVGMPLFDRGARTVRLTTAGKAFMEYAKRALQEVDAGVEALQELEHLKHGNLTIGVLASLSTSILPSILADFAQTYPGIHVTMLQLPSILMEKRLREGELSFGIAYGPLATDRVIAEELFKERMAVIVGAEHPLFGKSSVRITGLPSYGLIMQTQGYISRQLIESAFLNHGLKPNIAMEMNAIEPILATVRRSGTLATVLSERLARTMPGLHAVTLMPHIVRTVSLFTRRHAHISPAARTMADLIKKNCGVRG